MKEKPILEHHRDFVRESNYPLADASMNADSQIQSFMQDRHIGQLYAVALSAIGPSPVFKGLSLEEQARQANSQEPQEQNPNQ